MATRKLILEIPESLFQELERLAEATDQSTESLAINCIARRLTHDQLKTGENDLDWQDTEEIDEQEWLHAAASNPVFNYLKDPEEDIYTLTDGKPFND